MRKIFISIPWFLPAFRAGGPIQSIANLVKSYNKDVHYFIYTSDADLHGAALGGVKTNEWLQYNPVTHIWYAAPDKTSENLVHQVERIKPDVLLIVGVYSWHFNLVPLIYCKVPLKILSARGMLHPEAVNQKWWKKKLFIRLFKLMEYHHKVVFHATDGREAGYIKKVMGPAVRVAVAGNFPNTPGFAPMIPKERGMLKLVSVGIVSPMKNYLFVLQALAVVRGTAEYHVYGAPKDEEYWHECKEKAAHLPGNIKVQFHREIEPAQVAPALAAAHVFVLPSRSENFGHAILESLHSGRPVITSQNTPWNELEAAGAGYNVDIHRADELVAALNKFADMDFAELAEWGRKAAVYASAALDEEKLRNDYEQLFALK